MIIRKLHPLAIMGNPSAFPVPIRFGTPNIGNRKLIFKRIGVALDRRWLTNDGAFVREFEERIADTLKVNNCIAVNNATIGLQIAARVLDLSGEVVVPAFTFIATPHALEWQGVHPKFCDIDPNTHNIDPYKIESLITPQTSGILGTHVWGRPCQIDLLQDIANRYQIRLFFDAAHAFGSSYQGKMIGNFGDMEVISFHATKFINTLEGGVILTNDHNLAQAARSMRNFGFVDNGYSQRVGTNGKMNEFSAIMGLTLLETLDKLIERNYMIYQQYQRKIQDIPGVSLINYDIGECNNYQFIIVEVDETITQINRDQLMSVLSFENIFTRRYFYPGCHRMEPYYSRNNQVSLPNTDLVARRVIALPTGNSVSVESVNKICHIIQTIIYQCHEIKGILEQ
jgi:dTDP-4-amino-4,6-dideoxygalactose transaminase